MAFEIQEMALVLWGPLQKEDIQALVASVETGLLADLELDEGKDFEHAYLNHFVLDYLN